MSASSPISLPDAPALAAGLTHTVLLRPDGTVEEDIHDRLLMTAQRAAPMLCHLPALCARWQTEPFPAHDVLELFAFVHPARVAVPTIAGLCQTLKLPEPDSLTEQAACLPRIARALLRTIADFDNDEKRTCRQLAATMGKGGWMWAPFVAMAAGGDPVGREAETSGLSVWRTLPETEDYPIRPPPGQKPVAPDAAIARLRAALGPNAEARPGQEAYARAVITGFAPREDEDAPQVVLAEAGTGTGKTLGYIAPASVWAEQNDGAVWIATYTRNLQRQLSSELARVYPDDAVRREKVVVRKGRENYLCLLNLEEAAARVAASPHEATALGLMARWAAKSRDGDLIGGDFPGWLVDLLGYSRTLGLADRRGECIYSACAHLNKCFVERTLRRARHAEIVVANHALVMVQAAMGGLDDATRPSRYVFDEGHHLFDAADSAFSAHLSGLETAELRRWLLGAEKGSRSRARGLKRRVQDVLDNLPADDADTAIQSALSQSCYRAEALPLTGWLKRLEENEPSGPTEAFLGEVRRLVRARSDDADGPYSLEAPINDLPPEIIEAGGLLKSELKNLEVPLKSLVAGLRAKLDAQSETLDTQARNQLDGLCRSIERRALSQVTAWIGMLDALDRDTPEEFIDWAGISREGSRTGDVGLHRHWLDPTLPFANAVLEPAHGAVLTSATLCDRPGVKAGDAPPADPMTEETALWQAAYARTGVHHLTLAPHHTAIASPFDYAGSAKVLVVRDIPRDDMASVAGAFRDLFIAAGGGAIGLFTAIARLYAVHERLKVPLEHAGLDLLAQHVDRIDIATLLDMFRADVHSCLLGTDAVRDGVDIPGDALRLLVFDRVPWPRPDILHRARRAKFGKTAYDDMICRLRLKQAFGRLIRKRGDRGVFVMLDARLPTRLTGAFPEGVEVERVGIADAIRIVRGFLT